MHRASRRRQYVVDEWIDAFDAPVSDNLVRPAAAGPAQAWTWKELPERIAYKYFCWRCRLLPVITLESLLVPFHWTAYP